MKTIIVGIFAVLLVGGVGSGQNASLTSDQATSLAIKLANLKADTTYHFQPFHDGHPARFIRGLWVWCDARGYGRGDVQATVELAANGSTNNVDIEFFDNQNILRGTTP